MDLNNVPLDVSVILQTRDQYDQCEDHPPNILTMMSTMGTNQARCVSERHDKYVWMELRRTVEGDVAIWSVRTDRFLSFDQHKKGFFKAESIEDGVAFELRPGFKGGIIFVPKGTNACVARTGDGSIVLQDLMYSPVEWSLVAPSFNSDVMAGLASIDSSLKALERSLESLLLRM